MINFNVILIAALVITGTVTALKNRRWLARVDITGTKPPEISHTDEALKLRHNILLIAGPAAVLAVPFVLGESLNLADVLQAASLFLAIRYIQLLYWE